MKKILAIVGSLRKNSWNRQVAEAAKEMLAGEAEFEILDYSEVPMMNEDWEANPPAAVSKAREKVAEADGLWFFTPEYNHGIPGVLKNLIDWLSRPLPNGDRAVILGKKAAISGATVGGGSTYVAQDLLVMTLSVLNLDIMNQPRTAIGKVHEQSENGKLKLGESKTFLEKQAKSFLNFLDK